MIKYNISATGRIQRSATMRQSHDGTRFVSFSICVQIPDKDGKLVPFYIGVSCSGDESTLASFSEGTRVSVSGIMRPHKQHDTVYYDLKATSVSLMAPPQDSLSGDMEFRGTVGKSIQQHKDRKGSPFLTFSAFSSDKDVSGEYYFIWTRFVLFSDVPGEWFVPGAGFDATGNMELSVYKGNVEITCRIRTIARWDKPKSSPQS